MITLSQVEGVPASYPVITGLSTEANALNQDALWQRIEAHVVDRWTSRAVVWIVEGAGEWIPPLKPYFVDDAYKWDGSAWVAYTLVASPLGYELPDGQYRIEATVGNGVTLPETVSEAFRRFAEYLGAEDSMPVGASMYESDIGGELRERTTRNAQHVAKALMNSGAADLLRNYRRI